VIQRPRRMGSGKSVRAVLNTVVVTAWRPTGARCRMRSGPLDGP